MSDAGLELDRAIDEHRELISARGALRSGGSRRARSCVRRLRQTGALYSESPGRTNIISGTTHAGEIFSR